MPYLGEKSLMRFWFLSETTIGRLDMKDKNHQLIKNTLILGTGQLVPKILSLVILPILTSHLSTYEYGVYDLILSIADLLIPIITIQIQQAVFRYLLSANDKKEKSEYITSAINYVLISSIIVVIISYSYLRISGCKIIFSIVVCLYFAFQAFYNLFGQIVRGLGNNLKYTLGVVVYSIINFTSILVFVVIFDYSFIGVLISLSTSFTCACIFMVLTSSIWNYYHPFQLKKETLKKLIGFSLPIVPSSISLWIVNLSDRFVILHYLGEASNGIYAVSNKIPVIFNTAYGVFNLAWTETAARVYEEANSDDYYSELFNALFKFLIGGMLILISITPWIFIVLVADGYQDALLQVPVLYIGAFFNSFVNFYSGIYIAIKKTRQVGISSAIGAMINLIINLLFVKYIGLFAASISTAVSFFLIAVFRAYDLSKHVSIKYSVRNLSVGFFFFTVLIVLFYTKNVFMYFLSFIIAVFYNFLFNRLIIYKLIKKIFAKLKIKEDINM